jgi:hypothetical protein
MDALDRLAARLAEILSAGGRGDPGRSVEIAEIFQTLVPYRRVRDEAGLDTAEDYELALLRLLAGERGYAKGDVAMQERITLELEEAVPDLTLYKAFARSRVTLVDGAIPSRASAGAAIPAAASGASPVSSSEGEVPRPTQRTVTSEPGERCRYCSQELPQGRRLTYCPHCGQNLTVLQCPACSTEMEMGWKFCVTCGRSAAAPA